MWSGPAGVVVNKSKLSIILFLTTILWYLPHHGVAFLRVPVRYHSYEAIIVRTKDTATARRFGLALFSSAYYTNINNNTKKQEERSRSIIHSYYLATTIPGLAGTLKDELSKLGCRQLECSGTAAVTFAVTDVETIFKVLLWSRVAHKIMELLVDSSSMDQQRYNDNLMMNTRNDVYNFVRQNIPVRELLLLADNDNNDGWRTFSVSATLNNPQFIPRDINHSHFTALTVKNALVDAARDETPNRSRPSVDTEDPDVPLVVVLRGIPSPDRHQGGTDGAQISIYRTIHNGSLHRRGYRSDSVVHKAGLKESMAAGLLLMTGWPAHHKYLLDPMMGSGTFLIEAAMLASDYAPGLMRIQCHVPGSKIPPIIRWKQLGGEDLDQQLWHKLLLEASVRAKRGLDKLISQEIVLGGNDIHLGAAVLAEKAIQKAGFANMIHIATVDCQQWNISSFVSPNNAKCLVVCNPPWGVRLTEDMNEAWVALRIFLRDICPSGTTTAWILSGNADATRHLKLRRNQSIPLQTGEQHLRWLQYTIGSQEIPIQSDQ